MECPVPVHSIDAIQLQLKFSKGLDLCNRLIYAIMTQVKAYYAKHEL